MMISRCSTSEDSFLSSRCENERILLFRLEAERKKRKKKEIELSHGVA